MPSSPEARLKELKLELPPAPKPVAKYKTAVQIGNVLYVSGHGPLKPDGKMIAFTTTMATVVGTAILLSALR